MRAAWRRLPGAVLSAKNGGTVTNKPPSIEQILDAFLDDRDEVPSPEELDCIYTEAISDGLVTESEIRQGFERFLARRTSVSGAAIELAPAAAETTVGELVRAYRDARGMTLEQLAGDRGVALVHIAAMEASDVPFDAGRVTEIARSLADELRLPVRVVHRLLQEARARTGLRSSTGPTLMAARKAPGK